MLQLMPRFTLLAAVTLAACAFPVQAAETVTITSSLASKGPFTAQLLRPSGAGPFPVVVALHGCGGLLNSRGQLRSREADWAERFLAAGYAVLFPDSFTARGMREICTNGERSIFPKDRADDALAAGEWLAGQPFVDRRRLALIGWSHGAMAVLWALRPGFMGNPPLFKTAIAFYPGCRQIDRLEDWRPSVPLTLMIGSADDWTTAGPLPQPRQAHRLPLHRVRQRLPRLRRAQLARARARGTGQAQGRQGARRHRSGGPCRLDQGGDGDPARGVPDAVTCATRLVAARAPDRL